MSTDFFEFMKMPRKMNLDLKVLEKTYYDLSRKFHPDFFQGKSDKEKFWSRVQSASLNKAYETLKDPIKRAESLLNLEVPPSKEEKTHIEPALVSEIFEIQEMVEEQSRTKDSHLKSQLQNAKKEVEGKVAIRKKSLEAYFKEWDTLGNNAAKKEGLAKTIRKTIHEIAYLKNLIQSIETGGAIRH